MSKKIPFSDPPPDYDSVIDTSAESVDSPGRSPLTPSLVTAYLSAHLSFLPTLIRDSQSAHLATQSSRDGDALALVLPHIESLLADVAAAQPPPTLAELTLVPAGPVPHPWRSSDDLDRRSDRRDGFMRKLVRVELPNGRGLEKKDGSPEDEKTDGLRGEIRERMLESAETETALGRSKGHEFDDWGRWGGDITSGPLASDKWATGELWWSDEEAAVRIARHLQPRPELSKAGGLTRRATTSTDSDIPPGRLIGDTRKDGKDGKDGRKEWKWGLFRAPSTGPASLDVGSHQRQADGPKEKVDAEQKADLAAATKTTAGRDDPVVTMTVKPEEVTFRKENDFGVWESRTGWGIVVRVRQGASLSGARRNM